MEKTSILFAIPCYGGQIYDNCVAGIYNVAKQLEKHGIENELLMVANESLISTGRSNIANLFINETKYEYIMLIDADIGFRWGHIISLLESRKQFVAGAYSMKVIPPQYNFQITSPINWEGNLLEIDHIGTGFQLIHRSVFEEMAKAYPDLKYTPNDFHDRLSTETKANSYHFYQTMIEGSIVPEDISFCKRWKGIGGKIWLNTDIELTHSGNHIHIGIPNLKEELKKATQKG